MIKTLASKEVLHDSSGYRPLDRVGFGDNMAMMDGNIFRIRSLSAYYG